jgi:GNAT superfamily N-acetyltransferase
VIEGGATYVFDDTMSREEFIDYWCNAHNKTFVAVENDTVLGSYFMKPNYPGRGAHTANCGYIVNPHTRGKGVGRALGLHSIQTGHDLAYRSIQFNFVVSTNQAAVRLWESLGFRIIGTTPGGFRHKDLGFVDSYMMFQELV